MRIERSTDRDGMWIDVGAYIVSVQWHAHSSVYPHDGSNAEVAVFSDTSDDDHVLARIDGEQQVVAGVPMAAVLRFALALESGATLQDAAAEHLKR